MMDTDLTEKANEPWDGTWFVKPPKGYIRGLFRVHQVEAHHLLKRKVGLTNWSAHFLQVLRYQFEDLTSLQSFWLKRIEKETEAAQ